MKLAIIGASTGQLPLCEKAKKLGINTICFAWPKGAICRDVVDKFYPISIFEKDTIVEICKSEQIDGVVSNASDLTAEVVSFIATELNLHGIEYESFIRLKDKSVVRHLTRGVKELCQVKTFSASEVGNIPFPCVVKPKTGAAKKGVFFISSEADLRNAVEENLQESDDVIIEEFISGQEVSVETISFENKHYVVQITDKCNSGAPHFVELAHHQPSLMSDEVWNKIRKIVPDMLNAVSYRDGAAHVELKVGRNNEIYLIEINPRGGGDEISNKLVQLSTGYDYVKGMIDVALGQFEPPIVQKSGFAGVYYLCNQTAYLLPIFKSVAKPSWLVEMNYNACEELHYATDNYSRDGFFIYHGDKKVVFDK